jgi:hypothetical protein
LEWTNIELTGHTKLLGINIKILQRWQKHSFGKGEQIKSQDCSVSKEYWDRSLEEKEKGSQMLLDLKIEVCL